MTKNQQWYTIYNGNIVNIAQTEKEMLEFVEKNIDKDMYSVSAESTEDALKELAQFLFDHE